jgi:hypothetical protein
MASTRIDMGGRNANSIEQHAQINMTLAVPANTVAGDVVQIEEMVVYVQTDRDAAGNAQVTIPCRHVQVVEVYGRSDGADAAVAVGNILYFDAGDGQINIDTTNGIQFGYALEAVGSGLNVEIEVGFGL